jgi:pyruvate dehydrogenase E1 component
MLPVYIYYSMFGFQRVGDLIWAAADQRARGLLWGATAGRTTLGGEGLQHQDGASLVMAAAVPNCRAWDPATAGELAVILDHALQRMLVEQHDEFHYIVLMNEAQPQPSLPPEAAADVLRGLWRCAVLGPDDAPRRIRLLGSGTLLAEVLAAAAVLAQDHGVRCEVFSATSYSELTREAEALQHATTRAASAGTAGSAGAPAARCDTGPSQLQRLLPGPDPIVAVSDYVRAWPQRIAAFVQAPLTVLGTDGFGRSDTRQRLRRHFGVDRAHIVAAALHALGQADTH